MPIEGQMSNPVAATAATEQAIRAVCAILAGPHKGTGVLIGRDLVLTAYHVIGHVRTPEDVAEIRCVFDYAEDAGGRLSGATTEERVASVDLCFSEPSPGDLIGGEPLFEHDRIDFAILRLARPAGVIETKGRPRGWITLPRNPVVPDIDDEIFLFQHPEGPNHRHPLQPLKWGTGEVVDVLGEFDRIVHTAPSRPGSSGGPCFDNSKDFAFVGLHNAGHRLGDTSQRRFVPLFRIVAYIERAFADSGLKSHFFTVPAPPPVVASVPCPSDDPQASRRCDVALLLMDRTPEEIRFRKAVEVRPVDPATPPPRVHFLVSRDDNLPRCFTKRLQYLQPNSTKDGRTAVVKDGLAKGELARSFDLVSLGWPPMDKPEIRRREIDAHISDLDLTARQLVVFEGPHTSEMTVRSERALVRHLGARLQELAAAGAGDVHCLVVLVVDGDRPDANAVVDAYSEIWPESGPPPGCGISERLRNVRFGDLDGWRQMIEAAFGDAPDLQARLNRVFESRESQEKGLPMERVRKEVQTEIEKLVRVVNLDGPRGQP